MWYFNVHCHFLTLDHVPNSMVKNLSSMRECFLKSKLVGNLLQVFKLSKYPRAKEYIRVFKSDGLVDVCNDYTRVLNSRFQSYAICPLAMDFSESAPDATDNTVPYYLRSNGHRNQIHELSELVKKYPYRIFPFVMYDPRRPNAYEVMVDCIENRGFIGVKLYPALGFFPDPRKEHNNQRYVVAENLRLLYEYCASQDIPITVHASIGGAYKTVHKKRSAYRFTEIENWFGVLSQYALKINFAHMGGDYLSGKRKDRERSKDWRGRIIHYMDNKAHGYFKSKVYADVAFHDMALDAEKSKSNHKRVETYFADLNTALDDTNHACRRILYGTDAYMTAHTWTEDQYLSPFEHKISDKNRRNNLFWNNPVHFLFKKNCVPDTYVNFTGNPGQADLPPWIKKQRDGKMKVRLLEG